MSLFAEQFPVVFQALNEGFLQTLKLFFITLAGAIPLGLVICLGSMSRFRPLRYLVRLVIWVVRGTPLMLQLLIIYFFPGLVLKNNIWGQGELGRFAASCAAFVFNYACYFSEIYRGGIESMPRGQYEAGAVLGMTKTQVFFKIILFQVVKKIVPPMGNEIITLVKDTSLARIISVYEIIWAAQKFAKMDGLVWPLFYTGVYYLIFSGVLTLFFGYIEKKLDYYKG